MNLSLKFMTLPAYWRQGTGGGGLLPDMDETVFIIRQPIDAIGDEAEISIGHLDVADDDSLVFFDAVQSAYVTDVVAWANQPRLIIKSQPHHPQLHTLPTT